MEPIAPSRVAEMETSKSTRRHIFLTGRLFFARQRYNALAEDGRKARKLVGSLLKCQQMNRVASRLDDLKIEAEETRAQLRVVAAENEELEGEIPELKTKLRGQGPRGQAVSDQIDFICEGVALEDVSVRQRT